MLRLIACVVALCLSGCASVLNDSTQSIRVDVKTADNKPVDGADCVLNNNHGEYSVVSGRSTLVRRSSEDLEVMCTTKEERATGRVTSRVNGAMFGNIILGGAIGAVVDHSRGTAYTYPSWIQLILGRALSFDRKNDADGVALQGTDEGAAPSATPPASVTAGAAIGDDFKPLRFALREVDTVSRAVNGETVMTIDRITSTATLVNGGATELDATGAIVRGTMPLPHVAGLGGGILQEGYAGNVRYLPSPSSMGPVPAASARVRVLNISTMQISGVPVVVARCRIEGRSSTAYVFGVPPQGYGSVFEGEILVEVRSGIVLRADIKSAHQFFAVRREFVDLPR